MLLKLMSIILLCVNIWENNRSFEHNFGNNGQEKKRNSTKNNNYEDFGA